MEPRDLDNVKLIECPRDAWQGLPKIIPAQAKAEYLEKLIKLGFRHLDAVSFVAPKHVPQMADSEEVLKRLVDAGAIKPRSNGKAPGGLASASSAETKSLEIIGIVVNEKGLERALAAPGVTTIGYPYSVSANFRRQNANMSLAESRKLVEEIYRASKSAGRGLVVYISMAFGNPFDEPWGAEIVVDAVEWLEKVGVKEISLADTVGAATPKAVGELFKAVHKAAKGIEVGVHLHSRGI
jgi:hydroxymethylglutaryl-CoA lyase